MKNVDNFLTDIGQSIGRISVPSIVYFMLQEMFQLPLYIDLLLWVITFYLFYIVEGVYLKNVDCDTTLYKYLYIILSLILLANCHYRDSAIMLFQINLRYFSINSFVLFTITVLAIYAVLREILITKHAYE